MNFLDRVKNQRISLSEPTDTNEPAEHELTVEQWETITDALNLEDDATADEVVAAVAALAETRRAEGEDQEQQVAASAEVERPVIIDAGVWKDMQRSLKLGMTAEKQRHRLAAEQVVDQAIRLGKASAAQREHWIAAYGQDPEATIHSLNRGEEIPRMEIGYGIDPEAVDGTMPKGWVR